MKPLWHNRKARAFTLIELLVVIAIIAILAALLLPVLTRGKQRAQRIQCIGNLNELGIAFQIFAHDHGGRFPMEVPTSEGGSEEFVTAGESINGTFYFSYRHLQTLANELVVPRILICPSDLTRAPAMSFGVLQNSNVSYFVGVDANYNLPNSVLAGDRNITNDAKATASLVRGAYGLRWTSELHFFKGNVLFSDTHVEQLNNAHVELPASTAANPVLFLPASRPPTLVIPASPPGGNQPLPATPTAASPGGSTTAPNDGQPAPLARAQNNAAPGTPTPASPPSPSGGGMSGSTMMGNHGGFSDSTLIEAHARETNGAAVKRDPKPTAAPAVKESEEAPLLLLHGAAPAPVTEGSWWLLLLLLLLIATALYLYARRKMRQRRDRST
jgi:prepilin-type N-terminal cleavage/methylation domain-containing protein